VLGGAGVAAALVFGFACGGNVVVDPGGSGGAGGSFTTSTTTSMADGSGGFGAACPVPSPVGSLYGCSGSVSSGSGAPTECTTFYCDSGGNDYTESCSSGACSCTFNGTQLCVCATSDGDICAGTAEPCCPFPVTE
jgi:hypothetical protein